jgi:hypothetical protein
MRTRSVMNEAVMDEDTQNQSTWEPYVGRGALGGSIGMLVVVAIGTLYVLMRYGSHNLIEALVVAGLMAIISGVITGLAVGYMIYRIRLRRHAQLTAAMRIAIGIGAVLAYQTLAQLTRTEPFHPIFVIGYAVAVGGLAGLFARAKKSAPATDVVVTSA